MTEKLIARLTVYGLSTMSKKEHKKYLKWLEDRLEEAKRDDFPSNYSPKCYTARLLTMIK